MTSSTATPAKAEALSDDISFEFEGLTYTLRPAKEWGLEVMEALEDGKAAQAIRQALTPEEWLKFRTSGTKARRSIGDFDAFARVLLAAAGLGN